LVELGARSTGSWAEGEEVNSPADGDGTQQLPSENDEYAPDEYALPPAAKRLLRPRRSYVAPIIVFIVFGVVVLLVTIEIGRLGPIEQRAPFKMRPHRRRHSRTVFPNNPSSLLNLFSRWFWIPLNRTLLLEVFPWRRCLKAEKPQRPGERIAKPSRAAFARLVILQGRGTLNLRSALLKNFVIGV
jgi:hypothetical protein